MSKPDPQQIAKRLFVVYSKVQRGSKYGWRASLVGARAHNLLFRELRQLGTWLPDQQLRELHRAICDLFQQPQFPAAQVRELIEQALQGINQ